MTYSNVRLGLQLVLFFFLAGAAFAGTDYRDRGNRNEGTIKRPVTTLDVRLLAAFAEPAGARAPMPTEVGLSFVPGTTEHGITLEIQERVPRRSYRLDRVRPAKPWRAHDRNTFAWPSTDVLRPLRLGLDDLLPLVRLGRPAGHVDHVAPVRWRTAGDDGTITGYRFVFSVGARVETRHHVLLPDGGTTTESEPEARSPRNPFDVVWRVRDHPEGNYRLVLEGTSLEEQGSFRRTVRFLHTPRWPD